jgi:hypothetical protein
VFRQIGIAVKIGFLGQPVERPSGRVDGRHGQSVILYAFDHNAKALVRRDSPAPQLFRQLARFDVIQNLSHEANYGMPGRDFPGDRLEKLAHVDEVRRGMIVEATPVVAGPRGSDRNIAIMAEGHDDIYQPSRHLDRIRDRFETQGKDPEAFVRFHVRRLEALRRAGHVERLAAD